MRVPIKPTKTPCSMKMRRICWRRAPMETRTAMSLVFSMTIMINEIKMLSAATKTMRPMVIKVTTFSRRRARKSAWFCSIQFLEPKPCPATFSSSWAMTGAW